MVLTREEVNAVMAELSGTPRLVVSLLYGAGLRLQEALGLGQEPRPGPSPGSRRPRSQISKRRHRVGVAIRVSGSPHLPRPAVGRTLPVSPARVGRAAGCSPRRCAPNPPTPGQLSPLLSARRVPVAFPSGRCAVACRSRRRPGVVTSRRTSVCSRRRPGDDEPPRLKRGRWADDGNTRRKA